MRAAVMRGVGAPLTIERAAIDEPGPHEVAIRVGAAGLCHSDLHFIDGRYDHPTPTILGHESAGVVEAMGSAVGDLAVGDHVLTHITGSCGACPFCRDGRPVLCTGKDTLLRGADERPRLSLGGQPAHQFLGLSSFAERMLVHERSVVPIPTDIPLDLAATLGCGVTTGLGAVFNGAGVQAGQAVAVLGCGGVGLAAIQGARIAGAGVVIAIDRVPAKLALATALGATHTIDPGVGDPVAATLRLTGGLGVHHAIEAVGTIPTSELAFALLRRGGTATIVGLLPDDQQVRIPAGQLYHEKRIQGSTMGSSDFTADIPRYLDLHRSGSLDLDALVTDRIPLEKIDEGFAAMRAGASARTVIVFD